MLGAYHQDVVAVVCRPTRWRAVYEVVDSTEGFGGGARSEDVVIGVQMDVVI